jgi:hypothetical protein
MPNGVALKKRPRRDPAWQIVPVSEFLEFQAITGVSLGEWVVSRIGSARKYPIHNGGLRDAKILSEALAHGGAGELIGLGIILARDVGDGEFEGTGQLPAGPVKRIKTGATAGILAAHLANHHFGIGINMQCFGFHGESALQGFHQGHVFGNIIILVADPLGDANGAGGAAIDNDANAGGPRISQGTTVHVGYKVGHDCRIAISKMRRESRDVKTIIRFGPKNLRKGCVVQFSVQIESESACEISKRRWENELRLQIFTAAIKDIAPIVCVDFC